MEQTSKDSPKNTSKLFSLSVLVLEKHFTPTGPEYNVFCPQALSDHNKRTYLLISNTMNEAGGSF